MGLTLLSKIHQHRISRADPASRRGLALRGSHGLAAAGTALLVALAAPAASCGGRTAPGLWWQSPDGGSNPQCGNGVLDPGEACDEGAANSDSTPDACRTNCQRPACGDGVRDSLEECDTLDFGGANCAVYGYDVGELLCRGDCAVDLSACTLCGDGICSPGETQETCATDCYGGCGDGVCDADEDPDTCPADCVSCGDGICSPSENTTNCPEDCGGSCGNGVCDPGEDPHSCPQDCSGYCGNGICEPGEDLYSCPDDCGYCGDGYCDPYEADWCTEDCSDSCGDGYCAPWEADWCTEDCSDSCGDGVREGPEGCDMLDFGGESCATNGFDGGQLLCTSDCVVDVSACTLCGDGICSPGETQETCATDCYGVCGDGVCDEHEDPDTCPADCVSCGDGICSPGESAANCPQDCGGYYCGDGVCTGNEPDWCPEDCGYCGDGVCSANEDPDWCPEDCASELSCQGILLCTYCCAPGQQSCRNACRQSGSAAAQNEFSQFRSCLQTHCSQECSGGATSSDCLFCGFAHCPNMCHRDTQGTTGCAYTSGCTGNCPEIQTGGTGGQCTTDPGIACQESCWRNADAQADALYQSYLSCIGTRCAADCGSNSPDPSACSDCISQQCDSEMHACGTD